MQALSGRIVGPRWALPGIKQLPKCDSECSAPDAPIPHAYEPRHSTSKLSLLKSIIVLRNLSTILPKIKNYGLRTARIPTGASYWFDWRRMAGR